jgi:fluoride exporter
MLAYLWIAIGGALGSVARYSVSDWIAGIGERHGSLFPWGTLLVNITGSFLIGILVALGEPGGRRWISPAGQQFFIYGVCGGYTTFSSFSIQTLKLMQEGEWLSAGGNVALSVVLCLVGVWLGYLLGAAMNWTKGG